MSVIKSKIFQVKDEGVDILCPCISCSVMCYRKVGIVKLSFFSVTDVDSVIFALRPPFYSDMAGRHWVICSRRFEKTWWSLFQKSNVK
jgi:hypothetical protein